MQCSLWAVFGGAAPPSVQIYPPVSVSEAAAPPYGENSPPISVSEAAAPPIRMMACKADLYSIVITKPLYTCKYTAIDCTIVTLVEDRGWIRE